MLKALGKRLAHSPPQDNPVLVIHTAIEGPRQQELQGSCYRIGRDSRSDVVIEDSTVSRHHALMERQGAHWLLSDKCSSNGLWWQGRRVHQLVLRHGDSVRLAPPKIENQPMLTFERRPPPHRLSLAGGAGLALGIISGIGLLLLGLSVLRFPIRGSLATVRGPIVMFDRGNRPLASIDDKQHRELAHLDDYPTALVDALLSSEDSRFWWHPGVDPVGTARALVTNLTGRRVLEGGSTLTQQLARSLYPDQVGRGESLARKWRELLVSLQLEARFSKHDLLLSYLNRVYIGAGWGFEDGSRQFFDKSASQLTLEEAALLVGMLPSPNGYDPCINPQAALGSRNRVLSKMAESGRISADQARAARRLPIALASNACRASQRQALPFYSDQVHRDLGNLVGPNVAAEGNFLIHTHLDPSLQANVEKRLRKWLDRNRSRAVSQGAVVVLDSRNGGIAAIAGGGDYGQSQFNRASMALRQPGSTFKLVPYVLALEQGAKPGDSVACGPLRWRGQFFNSGCGGSVTLRQAVAMSSNTAALRLARRVGLEAVANKAYEMGITTPLDPVPGLVLGQSEVTLLELTAAYASVANGGIWHPPTTIRNLTDAERCPTVATPKLTLNAKAGKSSSSPSPTAEKISVHTCRSAEAEGLGSGNRSRRVMKESTAKTMRLLLRSVVSGGTGTAANVARGAWGKTGTTNNGRDLLFVGYEPKRHWVIGIWLGNDDNSPTLSSSALAASLWGEIVRTAPPG